MQQAETRYGWTIALPTETMVLMCRDQVATATTAAVVASHVPAVSMNFMAVTLAVD